MGQHLKAAAEERRKLLLFSSLVQTELRETWGRGWGGVAGGGGREHTKPQPPPKTKNASRQKGRGNKTRRNGEAYGVKRDARSLVSTAGQAGAGVGGPSLWASSKYHELGRVRQQNYGSEGQKLKIKASEGSCSAPRPDSGFWGDPSLPLSASRGGWQPVAVLGLQLRPVAPRPEAPPHASVFVTRRFLQCRCLSSSSYKDTGGFGLKTRPAAVRPHLN